MHYQARVYEALAAASVHISLHYEPDTGFSSIVAGVTNGTPWGTSHVDSCKALSQDTRQV